LLPVVGPQPMIGIGSGDPVPRVRVKAWRGNRRGIGHGNSLAYPGMVSPLFFGLEVQRKPVGAIAQPGRCRSIGEDVSEMGIAIGAADFGAPHEMASVVDLLDGVFGNRLEKARPARTGFVFGFRGEKRRSTTYAMVDAVAFFHIVGVRKGAFVAVLAGHMILFGRKFFAPFTGGALLCVAHLGPSLVV